MKLPDLPDSPYLYTEWKDATTPARVSSTMYKEYQMREYAKQAAEAMREACAKAAEGHYGDGHRLAADIRALEIEV